jgi:hypothetical protein
MLSADELAFQVIERAEDQLPTGFPAPGVMLER